MSYMKKIIISIAVLLVTGLGNGLLAQNLDNNFDQHHVSELDQEDLVLKIFPNPTPDYVVISANQKLEGYFKLSNLVGKVIFEGTIENQSQKLDLLEYRTGIYIISIYDKKGKQLATRKIIKN